MVLKKDDGDGQRQTGWRTETSANARCFFWLTDHRTSASHDDEMGEWGGGPISELEDFFVQGGRRRRAGGCWDGLKSGHLLPLPSLASASFTRLPFFNNSLLLTLPQSVSLLSSVSSGFIS